MINYLKQVQNVANDLDTSNVELRRSAQFIQEYTEKIETTDDIYVVEDMNNALLENLGIILSELKCVYDKMKIFSNLYNQCEKGSNNYDDLFNNVIKAEQKLTPECLKNEFSQKDNVLNITKEYMKSKKKQEICIRNNQLKFKFACVNWFNDLSNTENAASIGEVTEEDIKYFIKNFRL